MKTLIITLITVLFFANANCAAQNISQNKFNKFYNIAVVTQENYEDFRYQAVINALSTAAIAKNISINLMYIDIVTMNKMPSLDQFDGILMTGGERIDASVLEYRKEIDSIDKIVDYRLDMVTLAREKNIPFFGICYAMQMMAIDFARNVLKMNAGSEEYGEYTNMVVIRINGKYKNQHHTYDNKYHNIRMSPTFIKPNTLASKIYNRNQVFMTERHNYMVNPQFEKIFAQNGLVISGYTNNEGLLIPEILEYTKHPFFIGVEGHPESSAARMIHQPLFTAFLEAIINKKKDNL